MIALAGATALVLAGGHPHTGFFVALLGGSYAMLRAATSAAPWRASLLAGTALALGAALTAVQVLPFLEYVSLSRGGAARAGYELNPFIAPASTLVTALVPNFLGHPGAGNFAGPTNYLEQQAYPGIATWLLAAVGIVAGIRRPRAWFFCAAAVTSMLVMYGAPGVHQLISRLPLIKAASLPRIGIVALASLAILAAMGLDEILRAGAARTAAPDDDARRAAASAGDPGHAGRKDTWPSRRGPARGHPRLTAVLTATLLGAAAVSFGLVLLAWRAHLPLLSAHGLHEFTARWMAAAVWLAAAVCVLAIARLHGAIGRSAAGFALAAVVALDLLLFGHGFHPLTPREQVFPVLPEIQRVQEDRGLFRVMGLGSALLPNSAMAYGLQDVRGYDGLTVARYAELLDAVLRSDGYGHQAVGLHSPLIDLLNVKYVFGVPEIPAPEGWFTKLTEGPAPLYRNERVMPRAFLVDAYKVQDGNPARRTLRDGLIDFHRVALLEQELPPELRPVPVPASTAAPEVSAGSAMGADGAPVERHITPGEATIAEYRDHRVVIQTNAPDRRLLVLTDVHYPGWTAAVDGRAAPLVRANFAFRAVPVPAGRHTVTFEYRSAPPAWACSSPVPLSLR